MKLLSRTPSPGHRQTLTGLGLILAAAASPVHAGWDCSLDANGEWSCIAAGAYQDESGASVVSVPDATSVEDAAIEATATGKTPVGEAVTTGVTASTNEANTVDTAATTDTQENAPANDITAPTHITRISDDWVPLEQLTSAQKQQLNSTQKHD